MKAAPRRVRLLSNPSILGGGLVVALVVAFSSLGPLIARHGPNESDFVHGVASDQTPVGPCDWFPLGADRLFRDVFARLAAAGRLSLTISVTATLIATSLGAAVGLSAGWCAGTRVRIPWPAVAGLLGAAGALALGWLWLACAALALGCLVTIARPFPGPTLDIDGWLMRVVDLNLALPFLLLVMAVGVALDRPSATGVCITLGLTGWLGVARLLRVKTMQIRSLDYVEAARALGGSTGSIVLRHVLPNVLGPLLVCATVLAAQMIVADSVLGYLGAGVSPPTPTWGRMILEGQDEYLTSPWLVAAPGTAILVTVWGFHMLGEGLRDALDPRSF